MRADSKAVMELREKVKIAVLAARDAKKLYDDTYKKHKSQDLEFGLAFLVRAADSLTYYQQNEWILDFLETYPMSLRSNQ